MKCLKSITFGFQLCIGASVNLITGVYFADSRLWASWHMGLPPQSRLNLIAAHTEHLLHQAWHFAKWLFKMNSLSCILEDVNELPVGEPSKAFWPRVVWLLPLLLFS